MSTTPRTALGRVEHQTLPEAIAEHLREFILDNRLTPGSRLPPESELCASFAASRVAVREAVKRLAGEGLVETRPGAAGGVYVARPDSHRWSASFAAFCQLQDVPVKDLIEFRIELEKVTASRAARRATEEQTKKLELIVADMSSPGIELDRFHELDIEFHTRIAEVSGNQVFALFMHSARFALQRAIMDAYNYIADPETVNQRIITEHVEITRHIRAGNAAAASRSMRRHIKSFYAAFFERRSTIEGAG